MKNKIRWIIPVILLGGIPFTLLYTSKSSNPSEQLYQAKCASCHMDKGEGLKKLIPPLAGADYLARTEELACLIKNGIEGEMLVNGVSYNQPMPGNPELTDIQISNLINYIRNEWGNKYPYISPQEVKKQLENCK